MADNLPSGNEGEISGSGTKKSRINREKVLETATAVLLGATTLLSAWATWIGSLHEGIELTHFTESNNTASAATVLYNEATQLVVQDITMWGSVQNYTLDLQAAIEEGDSQKQQAATAKLDALREMCSSELQAAIDWSKETGKSPFEKEGFARSYYDEADDLAEESRNILATGKQDNMNSDKFGLVAVIYSLVLFLLGISATFKGSSNRVAVMGTAVVLLVFGFVFMLSIPMPEGFDIFNYLGAK